MPFEGAITSGAERRALYADPAKLRSFAGILDVPGASMAPTEGAESPPFEGPGSQ